MTIYEPRLEHALVEAVGLVLLFTEVATDDEVDLDSAVRLQEAVAWSLRRLTPDQKDRISTRFRELADSRSWDSYAGSATRTTTLRQMPEILGLVPGVNEEPSSVAIREREGPAAISRKLVVVSGTKVREQARRQSEALRHNNISGRWEVPSGVDAVRAARLLDEVGAREIGVRIVPFNVRPVAFPAQPLIEALADCWSFTELTPEDLLDPDSAASLQEDVAAALTAMSKELRLELASLIDQVVELTSKSERERDEERLEILRQMPESIGLLEED